MRLILHIGGHFGTSYRVEASGDELLYWRFCEESNPGEDPETINPSEGRWNRFWGFMQRCSGWADRYENPGTLDGTSWLVEVEHRSLSIRSSGSNDYPENFAEFLDEVRALIGGKEFS